MVTTCANGISSYVNQNFSNDHGTLDGFDLIDRIRAGQNTIVAGTGGGGKSMFMRYLWLSLFERSDGKIPFFIELRNVNQFSGDSILTYIYHSILQTRSQVSERAFLRAVHEGEFIFLLDGFDEIVVEKRASLEREIVSVAENNPKLTIVLSSRPDDRFDGWHIFHRHNVLPLSKKQVIDLLSNAEFDNGVKKRFIQKVKDGLYETHKSFLSNPLLASMMLISYDHYNDIPEKMYLFYEQAFEAIYQRHDGTKAGFVRKFHSTLAPDEFKNVLSYFCLISYYEEKFEFNESELLSYIKRALRFILNDVDEILVQRDFIESVCILQKDGLSVVFSHRSFQEYFAAYCLSRVTDRKIDVFFSKFSKRYNDQVIKMVYDMNRDLVISKYIVPMAEKYSSYIKSSSRKDEVFLFMIQMNASFDIVMREKDRKRRGESEPSYHIFFKHDGEFADFVFNLQKIMPEIFMRRSGYSASDMESIREYTKLFGFSNISILSEGGVVAFRSEGGAEGFDFHDWFKRTGMYNFMKNAMYGTSRCVGAVKMENKNIEMAIDDILANSDIR